MNWIWGFTMLMLLLASTGGLFALKRSRRRIERLERCNAELHRRIEDLMKIEEKRLAEENK